MKYYIGIDGGGTKTKFTMCDADLAKLDEYVTTTCHFLQCGLNGLTEVIAEGLRKLCPGGVPACNSSAEIEHIFIGCAGYGDVLDEMPMLDEAIRLGVEEVFGKDAISFSVGNDCENALAGALAGKSGINIIAGTGSMGCGMDESGRIMRCGGWHHVIGSDEGSAYWIGHMLIHEFQRQSDGRDPKTRLYDSIKEALSLKSDDELIQRVVEEWQMDRTRIAALSPICSELLKEGDPFADDIIKKAAYELADIAKALYKRLEFKGEVNVSGTGGVFKIGEPLIRPFADYLAETGMKYTTPIYEPDIGSVIIAIRNSSYSR